MGLERGWFGIEEREGVYDDDDKSLSSEYDYGWGWERVGLGLKSEKVFI